MKSINDICYNLAQLIMIVEMHFCQTPLQNICENVTIDCFRCHRMEAVLQLISIFVDYILLLCNGNVCINTRDGLCLSINVCISLMFRLFSLFIYSYKMYFVFDVWIFFSFFCKIFPLNEISCHCPSTSDRGAEYWIKVEGVFKTILYLYLQSA